MLHRTLFPLYRSLPSSKAIRAVELPLYRSFSSQSIPIIDLGPYFRGDKITPAKQIGKACEEIGFFAVINHQIPQQIIDSAWTTTKNYFDLSVKEKKKLQTSEAYPYGYSGFMEENLSSGYGLNARPDLKECFTIGPYNPAAGMPSVLWPENPPHLQLVLHSYYQSLEHLSAQLLRLFALALDLPENWFDDKIDRHRSALRTINYPELSVEPVPGQIRAGTHTDYGSLTILAQDDAGGLEVFNRDSQWIPVPNTLTYEKGFVINLGDLMAMWTNDRWVSNRHRVVNPTDVANINKRRGSTRRQSMAFFHNINGDHLVECIPTCASASNPPKYTPIKAWDHLIQKHLSSVSAPS
jgi:isopenicillin N synthase-like dioxygenase